MKIPYACSFPSSNIFTHFIHAFSICLIVWLGCRILPTFVTVEHRTSCRLCFCCSRSSCKIMPRPYCSWRFCCTAAWSWIDGLRTRYGCECKRVHDCANECLRANASMENYDSKTKLEQKNLSRKLPRTVARPSTTAVVSPHPLLFLMHIN